MGCKFFDNVELPTVKQFRPARGPELLCEPGLRLAGGPEPAWSDGGSRPPLASHRATLAVGKVWDASRSPQR